ncbi:MAG: hypothetical protein FVQ79_10880 [Planctomycetes bacterium]|nr:hypothetical protein [Planctomycetota bacterium]
MFIEQVEVFDGFTLFPYFVKTEDEDIAINCFASTVKITYEKDVDGNDTEVELYTPAQRAKQRITRILNKQIKKYQEELVKAAALEAADIKTNVVT